MGKETKPTKPATKPARAASESNEGEGNKTADRNYREATQKFVNSAHGQAEIRGAGHLTADEERDAEAAEATAKAHAKEFDPEEVRRNGK